MFSEQEAEVFSIRAAPAGNGVLLLVNTDGPESEYASAALSAYAHVTNTYWFYKTRQPDSDELDRDGALRVNVNLAGVCNANFVDSPPRVQFFVAAVSCKNTATSTVVSHEYGHYLSRRLGITGSGLSQAFNEGFSDVVAMMLYDTPIIGEGVQGGGDFRDYRCHELPPCPCLSSDETLACANESTWGQAPIATPTACRTSAASFERTK